LFVADRRSTLQIIGRFYAAVPSGQVAHNDDRRATSAGRGLSLRRYDDAAAAGPDAVALISRLVIEQGSKRTEEGRG
jgi:hypothetical protein